MFNCVIDSVEYLFYYNALLVPNNRPQDWLQSFLKNHNWWVSYTDTSTRPVGQSVQVSRNKRRLFRFFTGTRVVRVLRLVRRPSDWPFHQTVALTHLKSGFTTL